MSDIDIELRNKFNEIMDSPWSHYITLSYNEVLIAFDDGGMEKAKEVMRRADISGYRREEAACGNI